MFNIPAPFYLTSHSSWPPIDLGANALSAESSVGQLSNIAGNYFGSGPLVVTIMSHYKPSWHGNGHRWALRWRHNGRDNVSNHQSHDCLLNRLFRRRSKKTSKILVTGLFAGNSPGTGEFPAQKASNAENVSIWWRHHDFEISWQGGISWMVVCCCYCCYNRDFPIYEITKIYRQCHCRCYRSYCLHNWKFIDPPHKGSVMRKGFTYQGIIELTPKTMDKIGPVPYRN